MDETDSESNASVPDNDTLSDDAIPAGQAIEKLILKKLAAARDKLIDRSLRNRLIHTNIYNKRARHVRIVDELPDEIYRILVRERKEMTFTPGQRAEAEDSDDIDQDIGIWVPEEDKLDERGIAKRHTDTRLQTQLTPEGLQKRLNVLFHESRTLEEEQGVNILYLALGFLKWFEAANSDVEHFAPLLLLPVELIRPEGRSRYKIRFREDDLNVNISLQAWLNDNFSIRLPDLPDEESWQPSDYFASIRDAVAAESRWEVLENEILLGFFSFSKFLLWRDLDPQNWPDPAALLEHPLLRQILARDGQTIEPDTPLFDDDRRIDEYFTSAELIHVVDADSSQTIAIQEALAGKNLVIQGPPGTGKSQTITNIVAGMVHAGKRILFLAEKMAALEVVYDRLKKVGLQPVCLENHSRKANKRAVLEQVSQAIHAPAPPNWSERLFDELEEAKRRLNEHSDLMHRPLADTGLSPFAVIGTISRIRDEGLAAPDFEVTAAPDWSAEERERHFKDTEELAGRLRHIGIPAEHPWRGTGCRELDPFDLERLEKKVKDLFSSTAALVEATQAAMAPLAARSMVTMGGIDLLISALRYLTHRPAVEDEILVAPVWTEATVSRFEAVVELGKRHRTLADRLDEQVVAIAWERNWDRIREKIAAHGESLFRIFNRAYREAVAAVRGIMRRNLPRRRVERLRLLDSLIEAQKLRREISSLDDEWIAAFGARWASVASDWNLLGEVAAWLAGSIRYSRTYELNAASALAIALQAKNMADEIKRTAEETGMRLQEVMNDLQTDEKAMFGDCLAAEVALDELNARIDGWRADLSRLNDWPPVREGLRKVRAIAGDRFADKVYIGEISPDEMVDHLKLAVMEAVWKRSIAATPELAQFDGRLLDAAVEQFRRGDRKRIEIAADQVLRKHCDSRPTGYVGEMGILRSELVKKTRHLPIRRLIEHCGRAMQRLSPLFLMSPLSVAQFLPRGQIDFDVLLIDEASQVRPEDALGAIARCKQVIVVGDDKQLPPTNFFNRMIAGDSGTEEDEEEVEGAAIRDLESILSLCDIFPRRMLRWHYRSTHPALIAVSNRRFYKDGLLLPPSVLVAERGDEDVGLVFHHAPSGYDRGGSARNLPEAEMVAEAAIRHAGRSPDLSLGIGTFSVAQRDAIRDLLDKKIHENEDVRSFFALSRPEPFFVKNLENVQGDERDVIFISMGYGKDYAGRVTQNFGPIGKDGGERRLNVLITRARIRCEVFSSLTADDIRVNPSTKPGVIALKEFLQFAEKGYTDVPHWTCRTFDSDFEESVAGVLRDWDYDVHPQVGMSGFYIDLGVLARGSDSRYLLGIECDGMSYHSSRWARDRDRLRQAILEDRGWRIYRIWSTDWFYRRENEEKRLRSALEKAEQEGPRSLYKREGRPEEPPEGAPPPMQEPAPPPARPKFSQPYREADLQAYRSGMPPDQRNSVLADVVTRIIEIEGPVHEEEIARRLATVWDLQRTGNRVVAATKRGLLAAKSNGRIRNEGKFWSHPSQEKIPVRDRSNVRSAGLRRADMLPPGEIIAAARAILEASISVDFDELIVEVARALGFDRTGNDLKTCISEVLQRRIDDFAKTESNGRLVPLSN